jgi:hypothetical protein
MALLELPFRFVNEREPDKTKGSFKRKRLLRSEEEVEEAEKKSPASGVGACDPELAEEDAMGVKPKRRLGPYARMATPPSNLISLLDLGRGRDLSLREMWIVWKTKLQGLDAWHRELICCNKDFVSTPWRSNTDIQRLHVRRPK